MNNSLSLNSYRFLGYFEVGFWVCFGYGCLLGFVDLACKSSWSSTCFFERFYDIYVPVESFCLLNKNFFANVCFHGFTIGWIKPYDVSFGFFSFHLVFHTLIYIGWFVFVSATCKVFFVRLCSFKKYLFWLWKRR